MVKVGLRNASAHASNKLANPVCGDRTASGQKLGSLSVETQLAVHLEVAYWLVRTIFLLFLEQEPAATSLILLLEY